MRLKLGLQMRLSRTRQIRNRMRHTKSKLSMNPLGCKTQCSLSREVAKADERSKFIERHHACMPLTLVSHLKLILAPPQKNCKGFFDQQSSKFSCQGQAKILPVSGCFRLIKKPSVITIWTCTMFSRMYVLKVIT